MPVTLRKRPQCHYCGKRLNTAKREGDRIPCDYCLADNYLDANNNILDVPDIAVNSRNIQSQLNEIESESDVFCRTCLTNQAFYVQALSNYLPDEKDPRYQRLLKALPEYEKNLELRYPQCCNQCEPRVAARIQEANYMAKSDHLRRVLHRKHDRSRVAQLRFRRLLISAAGIGYTLSLLIQLFWHALASQVNSQYIVPGITPAQCLQYWPIPSQCTNYIASFLPMSLLLGLLCIWWNPKWQHRLAGKEGRLTGLSKYYQTQFLLLIIRFAAWAVIQDLPALQDCASAVHTVLLVLLSTTTIYALTSTVKVDPTPLVDWQKVQAPLVRPDQFRPPQAIPSPPSSQGTTDFNIANFAAPPSAMYEPWKPPTPPTEDDGMDWAPSTHDFNPQPRLPRAKFEQKNPFYGTLPAAPVRGSLNPKAVPPPAHRKALGLPPGFFGLSKSRTIDQQAPPSQLDPRDTFAPPRFFPDKQETDTGLENIFDKMFSVQDNVDLSTPSRDRPPVSKNIFEQQGPNHKRKQTSAWLSRHQHHEQTQPLARMVLSSTIIIVLAITVSVLCTHQLRHDAPTRKPLQILPYTAAISVAHLFEEAIYTSQIEVGGLVVSLFKICLAVVTFMTIPQNSSNLISVWNKGVIGAIVVYMVEEIYHLCQLQSTKRSYQPPLPANTFGGSAGERTPHHETQYIEETITSHPSPEQPRQYAPPTHMTGSPFSNRDFGTVRKRDSDESIGSVSSINTTSTASGWKTPQNTGRTFDWQSNDRTRSGRRISTIASPFGGLSLGNDFGSGANIAGPRNRQTPAGGSGRHR